MSRNLLGTFMALVSAAGFGSMAIFAKIAYQAGLNIQTLLVLRFSLATLILWTILKCTKKKYQVSSKDTISLIILGVLGYGALSGLFFYAVSQIPAAIAGLLLYTYPVLVTILTALKTSYVA